MTQRRDSNPALGSVCQLPEAGGAASNTSKESTGLGAGDRKPLRALGPGLRLPPGLTSASLRRARRPPSRPPPPHFFPDSSGGVCASVRDVGGSRAPRSPPRARPRPEPHQANTCPAGALRDLGRTPRQRRGRGGRVLARFRKFPTARVVSEPRSGRRWEGGVA